MPFYWIFSLTTVEARRILLQIRIDFVCLFGVVKRPVADRRLLFSSYIHFDLMLTWVARHFSHLN